MKACSKYALSILSAGIVIVMLCFLYANSCRSDLNIPNRAIYYNGHMYAVFKSNVSWREAERLCRNSGGHLVTINNKHENDFVGRLVSQHGNAFWIGAYVKPKGDCLNNYALVKENNVKHIIEPSYLINLRSCDYVYINSEGRWIKSSSDKVGVDGYVCEWEVGKLKGLKQTDESESFVKLCWNDNPLAKGYVVYCYDNVQRRYVECRRVRTPYAKITGLQSGRKYRFAVSMLINTKRTELAKTYIMAATKPGRELMLQFENASMLKWQRVKADGYEIYYFNGKTGEWKMIDSVKGSTFKPCGRVADKREKYKVRAFAKLPNGKIIYGEYSNIVKR